MRAAAQLGFRAAAWLSVPLGMPLPACRREPAPPPTAVVAYSSGPVSLDPILAEEEVTISVVSNVYEPLVDRGARSELVPALATYWTSEDDDRTWVFRLREGVRFHDGEPMSAADVVRCVELARTRPDSIHRAALAAVESVAARDAATVTLRTRFPFATLPDYLTNVRVFRDPPRAGQAPIGTGPYRVASWSPGGTTRLEAVERAWAAPPRVRSVEFRVTSDARAAVSLLESGHAHLVPHVDPADHARLRGNPRVRLHEELGLRVLFLGVDCSGPRSPFGDLKVRRAVDLAIDREALAAGPLRGEAVPTGQLVTRVVAGWSRTIRPSARDLAEARRLLAEAGHDGGFAVELDFMPGKYRAMPEVAAALSAQLGEAGIRVEPRPRGVGEMMDRVRRRESRLWLLGWMTGNWDAGPTLDALIHSPEGGKGTLNGGACSDGRIDELLDTALREFDPERRRQLYEQVAAMVAERVFVVPLYQQRDLYAVDARLQFDPRVERHIRGAELAWSTDGAVRPSP